MYKQGGGLPDQAIAIDLSAVDYVDPEGKAFVVHVGGAGDLSVQPAGSAAGNVLIKVPTVGAIYPLLVTKVVRATTTATNLTAIR